MFNQLQKPFRGKIFVPSTYQDVDTDILPVIGFKNKQAWIN